MLQCLEILAEKFKECKFVKINGQECIEDYPEEFCPTLIIYKNENPIGHIKGLECFGGVDVISPDIIEWELAQLGVWKTQIETNPRAFQMHTKSKQARNRIFSKSVNDGDDHDANDDDDDEEESPKTHERKESQFSYLDLD